MTTKCLIPLGLLAVASLAAGKCQSLEFPCKNAVECVAEFRRCDGRRDCGDGSDEEGCDAHTVSLKVNASVTARLQFAPLVHNSTELHLCDRKQCSKMILWGEKDEGALEYSIFTGCTPLGRAGTLFKKSSGNRRKFPPGDVVLEMQHRPGQLAVWRQGRPGGVVEVPVGADYDTLRVRPFYWVTDMPVQFTGFQMCGGPELDRTSTRLPDGSSWFFTKTGTVSRVKPAERMTEKLHCSERAVECEIQRGNAKQFGTEYSNTTSTESSSSVSSVIDTSLNFNTLFVTAKINASISAAFTQAMSDSVSRGWSEETATTSTFVCHVPPGHTGWVEVEPEYIAKEGVIFNPDCSFSTLVKWFPKTAADGSIAGERYCVVETTNTGKTEA